MKTAYIVMVSIFCLYWARAEASTDLDEQPLISTHETVILDKDPANGHCPSDGILRDGQCFKIFREEMSRKEMLRICEEFGGDLPKGRRRRAIRELLLLNFRGGDVIWFNWKRSYEPDWLTWFHMEHGNRRDLYELLKPCPVFNLETSQLSEVDCNRTDVHIFCIDEDGHITNSSSTGEFHQGLTTCSHAKKKLPLAVEVNSQIKELTSVLDSKNKCEGTVFRSKCYFTTHETVASYDEGQELCQKLDGQFARIETPEDASALQIVCHGRRCMVNETESFAKKDRCYIFHVAPGPPTFSECDMHGLCEREIKKAEPLVWVRDDVYLHSAITLEGRKAVWKLANRNSKHPVVCKLADIGRFPYASSHMLTNLLMRLFYEHWRDIGHIREGDDC